MDQRLTRWLKEDLRWRPRPAQRDFNFASADGRTIAQVRLKSEGLRDLRDGLVQLAGHIQQHRTVDRAYLLIALRRTSPQRVAEQWRRAKAILLPDIAKRLHLVAAVGREAVTDPDQPKLAAMGKRFLQITTQLEGGGEPAWGKPRIADRAVSASWRNLEVEKVLLHRWLLKEGAISMSDLAGEVGCSYPTVQQVVNRLESRGLIARERKRSVALKKFSRADWSELLTTWRAVYEPVRFVDVTRRTGGAEGLLARSRRQPPPGVALALGGVAAARHWDPAFDLNGTPRVDLVLHAEQSQHVDLDFVKRLDPALRPLGGDVRGSVVLVVHPIRRRKALFAQKPGETLPFADPVETILHLNDLGLTAQAGDLATRMTQPRGDAR
jgi:hypothetical protein